MNVAPSLPINVWQILYASMCEQHIPYHVKEEAINAFRQAMQAAQQAAQQAAEPDKAD